MKLGVTTSGSARPSRKIWRYERFSSHDHHQRWRLHNLVRKRQEVIEARAFRQAPRKLVIARVIFALLLGSLTRPRLDFIRLQATGDVKQRRASIESPHAGEIRLAFSRAWRGGGQVWRAVRGPGDSWRGMFQPLGVKW